MIVKIINLRTTMIEIDKIERDNFSITYYKNGIVELLMKDNAIIDINDSMEQEKILLEKKPADGYLLLVVAGQNTNVTRESREYSNKNPMENKALAIITRSLPQKIVVNFMITIYRKLKPKYPVKMFLKKEAGINWLLNHG